MADKIDSESAQPPQQRVQRFDQASGEFVPVADEPQEIVTTEETPDPLKVGDAVMLTGHVLEIVPTQGGQASVKVQLSNGAAWVQSAHLERVDTSKDERIADLEAVATLQKAQIGTMQTELDKAAVL